MTLAPTRSGKGVGTLIPNLLTVARSAIVTDPKGENATVTYEARRRLGPVHVLDPFGVTGLPASAYNPLGRLAPDSPDLGEDAASLAEALVVDAPGQMGEAHWNEEAKALLSGLILFAVCHEAEDRRTLATVREYITLPPDRFRELLGLMGASQEAGGLVARAANRFLGKSDREASGVLSSAQRHTHFLDSPRIVASTARSDFSFASLRHEVASVFLVLPPNRLDAYSRWLRLLVSQALAEIARDAEARQLGQGANGSAAADASGAAPLREPTLFLLDEFAALGRLETVERHGPHGRPRPPALAHSPGHRASSAPSMARGPPPSSPTPASSRPSASTTTTLPSVSPISWARRPRRTRPPATDPAIRPPRACTSPGATSSPPTRSCACLRPSSSCACKGSP